MKKILGLLPVLALCLCLAGCGHFVSIMPGTEADGSLAPVSGPPEAVDSFHERALMEFIGWDEFASSYYSDTPVALSIYTPERGYNSPIFDRASIIAACDALRSMRVTGRVSAGQGGGQQTIYTFTMKDADQLAVAFAGSDLALTDGNYTVTGGEALSALTFPGYSDGYDIFDLYYDDSIRAFADSFAQSEALSVGRRSNGGATLASRDQTVIGQVFSLLQNARIARVEENPDQNIDLTQTTDYVFTMADNSYYTFTFTGPCLTVTVNADYGPVYYWLDGIDELANITILPESTVPQFAGGPITGLRDDIAQARSAANGELPGITVVGVYVDYTIQGQHGYLTLEGDTAVSFVQRVTAITANAETTTPSGEDITVFVTLSDQSGPIIVFTGDTVQQMVGVNHQCDANAMADLRAAIQQLAQDERNIGQMVSGGTN